MVDYIRENLMERMEKQVQIMKRVKYTICPRIRKKLECIRKKYKVLHCQAYYGG